MNKNSQLLLFLPESSNFVGQPVCLPVIPCRFYCFLKLYLIRPLVQKRNTNCVGIIKIPFKMGRHAGLPLQHQMLPIPCYLLTSFYYD